MKLCTKCRKEKYEMFFSKDKSKPDGLRSWCKTCVSAEKKKKGYKNKPKNRSDYSQIDTSDMIEFYKSEKFTYFLRKDGEIFKQCKSGVKQIEKRFGSRGFVELKIGGNTYLWHHIVAKHLVPNNCNGNMVFFKNPENKMDIRPENLRWVWTRYNRNFTPEQALERTTDPMMIEYYNTMDKRVLDRNMMQVLSEMKRRCRPERLNTVLGEMYIRLYNYADRCLLFDLRKDMILTYVGLWRQEHRTKLKLTKLSTYKI